MMTCASCREPIPSSSPSDDFCREQCQLSWYAGRLTPGFGGSAVAPASAIALRDRRHSAPGA